jgi:hypothetical protein
MYLALNGEPEVTEWLDETYLRKKWKAFPDLITLKVSVEMLPKL